MSFFRLRKAIIIKRIGGTIMNKFSNERHMTGVMRQHPDIRGEYITIIFIHAQVGR